MSNKVLVEAKIPEVIGPEFPRAAEKFQQAYDISSRSFQVITKEFLEHYAAELRFMLFHRVKVYVEFQTTDGTVWYAVRAAHDSIDYYILFPFGTDDSNRDSTCSAHHVAIYYENDEPISEATLEKVSQALYSVFEMTRRSL